MKFLAKDNSHITLLAACISGLVICPYGYIAFGALSSFPPAFSFIFLPPLILGSGFLFWRFLSKPLEKPTSTLLLVLEAASWIAIGVFLFYVSNFRLLTVFERIGLSCLFFLLASLISLPVVVFRETSLERRLAKLPSSVSIAALVVVLALSGTAAIIYLVRAQAFI